MFHQKTTYVLDSGKDLEHCQLDHLVDKKYLKDFDTKHTLSYWKIFLRVKLD